MDFDLENELLALKAIFDDDFIYETLPDQLLGRMIIFPSFDSPTNLIRLPIPPPEEPVTEEQTRAAIHRRLNAISISGGEVSRIEPKEITTEEVSQPASPPPAPASFVEIEHLRLVLHFSIPFTYPHSAPPRIVLEAPWLTPARRADILRRLSRLWDPDNPDVVMFLYADYCKEEAVSSLNLLLADPDDLCGSPILDLGMPAGSPPAELRRRVDQIMAEDRDRARRLFDSSTVTCGICFEEKKGSGCVRFGFCRHSYCLECCGEYFSLMIAEGDVAKVGCPDAACKRKRKARQGGVGGGGGGGEGSGEGEEDLDGGPGVTDDEIRRIVGDELFARHVSLVEKRRMERRPDVTWCPRPSCGVPVARQKDSDKLCICSRCSFAFCFYCHRTWHGVAQYCEIEHLGKLVQEYEESEGEKRKLLETRYGRKRLEKIVEEEKNALWIKQNAQRCPRCGVGVERSSGCSHMTCSICGVHFCYLCSSTLNKDKPYDHFSSKTSRCYNRLFEGNDGLVNEEANEDFMNFVDLAA
ncbi:E3 ubiquitin-protein ligase rnf14 [Irineochytrium annulatum]|nr:E3 ubiquitin-protein ligase rnf14 [Irineochytrium annulatum]